MIRVASLPVRKDDDARPKAAKDGGNLEAVGLRVFDVAVGQIERFAVGDVEDARGGLGFRTAFVCGAAGAGLALGEIEDAGAPAARMHGEQRAAAGLLDVVTVRGDGEDIDRIR